LLLTIAKIGSRILRNVLSGCYSFDDALLLRVGAAPGKTDTAAGRRGWWRRRLAFAVAFAFRRVSAPGSLFMQLWTDEAQVYG
jgi:hypothetical protein